MKIQSYELQMQSQYSFTQELLSFESFLPDEVFAKQDEIKGNDVLGEIAHVCECANNYNKPKTFFSIIDSLMHSIKERIDTQVESIEEMAENSRARSSQKLSLYERYSENESFSFSTTGVIKTDTQEMNINIDFSMSRSFIVENRIDTGRVFDPLVINYNGELPELSETRFSFDLDNDGEEEYSWWSYRSGARAKNVGWRIDYFFISDDLVECLEDAFILQDVTGSDHCPVGIKLDI